MARRDRVHASGRWEVASEAEASQLFGRMEVSALAGL